MDPKDCLSEIWGRASVEKHYRARTANLFPFVSTTINMIHRIILQSMMISKTRSFWILGKINTK